MLPQQRYVLRKISNLLQMWQPVYKFSWGFENTCCLLILLNRLLRVDNKFVVERVSHSVVRISLQHHGLQPARPLCPRNSPGKSTGVGSHSILQGIFQAQGLNRGLLHCKQTRLSESPGKPHVIYFPLQVTILAMQQDFVVYLSHIQYF